MQFLQMLLKEGKLSEEQALAYVNAIKKDIDVVEEKEAKEQQLKDEEQRFNNSVRHNNEIKLDVESMTYFCYLVVSLLERAAKEAAEGLKREKEEHELILR